MTAAGIAQGLGIEPKLRVDSTIAEVLSYWIYEDGNPIPKLCVKTDADLALAIEKLELPPNLTLDRTHDVYAE